jgi:tetratricopeptide (TPR) repeat protein
MRDSFVRLICGRLNITKRTAPGHRATALESPLVPRRLAIRTLLALVLATPLALFAQGHSHDGHDHDHAASDLGNIGKAHLETSCSQAAQTEIDRGVALIHSFWYAEAEQSFRRAAAADAECGMAWWGVAMANLHPIWAPPTPDELKTGREAAEKATQTGAKTDREKALIGAIATFYADSEKIDHKTRMLAYERAMAAAERGYPKDREAAIFHALSLLGIAQPNDKTYAHQKQAAEILNRVLPEEPEHPGIAHYLIHSFDYPELAQLALPAARVYARLAPGSPHALHMPSHIFTRLGLWDESIASNLASAEKAHNYITKRMPGAAAFDELHATDYLVYAYLQQGKVDEARKLVEKTAAITKIDNPANFAALYAIGAVPARYALERRQWKEAAALPVPTNVAWEKVPYAEGNIHFARGIGAARSGQPAIARDAISRLAAIRQLLLDQKNSYWADQVEIQRLSVAAWLAHAEKHEDQALQSMHAAVDLEASTEKHPVTPGAVIPARELLAEMLLEEGKRDEALTELQHVLRDAPGRRNAMQLAKQAQVKEQAGKR